MVLQVLMSSTLDREWKKATTMVVYCMLHPLFRCNVCTCVYDRKSIQMLWRKKERTRKPMYTRTLWCIYGYALSLIYWLHVNLCGWRLCCDKEGPREPCKLRPAACMGGRTKAASRKGKFWKRKMQKWGKNQTKDNLLKFISLVRIITDGVEGRNRPHKHFLSNINVIEQFDFIEANKWGILNDI